MESRFEVSRPGRRTLALRGDLDMSTASTLMAEAEGMADEPDDLVLDLGGLTFLDSTGIRAIIHIANSLVGSSLILSGARGIVERVLDLCRLDGHGHIRVVADFSSMAMAGPVELPPNSATMTA